MRTLLWVSIAAMIYSAPMTVEYTADGNTYLVDSEGYEWTYEQEIQAEEVNVLIHNNGTPDISDDIIIAIEEVIDL